MNAVNAVLLFIMVWTFSPVCQANDIDDDFSVSCDNVTGTVGSDVNLTCSVSLRKMECCIKMYKFSYPKSDTVQEICKEEPPVNPCDKTNSFTCRYTPTKAMTEKFKFYVQTVCGSFKSEFTVDISEKSFVSEDTGSKDTVIGSVVGCSVIIIILIIILMTITWKKQSFGFQRRMFLCIKHDEDNSNSPDNVI